MCQQGVWTRGTAKDATGSEPAAAMLLIGQHGQDATHEAAIRADELLDAGDLDGQRVWMRIRKAVLELLKMGDGEVVH